MTVTSCAYATTSLNLEAFPFPVLPPTCSPSSLLFSLTPSPCQRLFRRFQTSILVRIPPSTSPSSRSPRWTSFRSGTAFTGNGGVGRCDPGRTASGRKRSKPMSSRSSKRRCCSRNEWRETKQSWSGQRRDGGAQVQCSHGRCKPRVSTSTACTRNICPSRCSRLLNEPGNRSLKRQPGRQTRCERPMNGCSKGSKWTLTTWKELHGIPL